MVVCYELKRLLMRSSHAPRIGMNSNRQTVKPRARTDLSNKLAPPHLPCGNVKAGATEILMPGIGWASAVPDAKAMIDFEIGDTKLQFEGVGYHDKVGNSVS